MTTIPSSVATPTTKMKARSHLSAQGRADARLGLLLSLPAVLAIGLIAFFPLGRTIHDSLYKISLRFENAPRPFVGLDNFRTVWTDARWYNALRVTFTVVIVSVGVELVLGMLIALLINRSFRGRGIVRAAVLVPWALTTVVSAKMWSWIYDAQYGVFNDLLMKLHIISKPLIWLANPSLTLWALIGAEIWKTTSFMALLLLAGLQLIPAELYEAAAIDGSTGMTNFWKITLPLLKPSVLVALLFRTIDATRIFDLIKVMTNGGPGQSTESINIYTYNTLFTNLNFGFGSALSVSVFLVIFVISFFYIKVLGTSTAGGR